MNVNRTPSIALVAAAALAAGIGAALLLRGPGPALALQSGTMLAAPRVVAPFSMVDQNASPFTQDSLKGHWTLLFAGFTHCPDVCPTTLATLRAVGDKLGAKAPALVFLSVDPARDTPGVLRRYVEFFGSGITGLSGSAESLDALCTSLGLAYVKVPGASEAEYTMDHSSALVLIDPQGRVAGYFTPPHKVDTLAADLSRVVES
ncbi:MAG TPA: SCO family protein [Verrucomicrobiae bacterium]|nr:SCO family protein [Verrucomicrobiae bacterium]